MDPRIRVILDELRRRLRERYGDRLHRLVLFGSHARGDAGSNSDIDVLVVLRGKVNSIEELERSIDIIADLSLEYDDLITCVFVSYSEFRTERSPLMLNVRREGIRI